MRQPKNLTISSAHNALIKKEVSCVELTKAYLNRIKKIDKKLNAFLFVTEKQALTQAKEVDKKISRSEEIGELAGIPYAAKDLFCTKGIKTTAGSKILENYIPPFESTTTKRLENQDAILIGKTNLDEFAHGASGEHSAFGPTHNPWDTTRVPGGSSAGSAASVAADECIFSLGTDTGGSIRQPASFCGVVGFKPTYGRTSRYGVIAMASSIDTIGHLTKTVEDSAIILKHIAGQDPRDATTGNQEVPDYPKELINPRINSGGIKGLKIGIPKEYFGDGLNSEVRKFVESAIAKLKELGAEVINISLPLTKYAIACYYIIQPAEVSSNLARYDGIKYGHSAKQTKDLLDTYLKSRAQGFGDEAKRRIMLGTYTLSAGYYDAYYLKAQKVRTLIINDFNKVFEKVDIIATPVAPTTAFKINEKTTDPLQLYLEDVYTASLNLYGGPGISVPCGFSKNLPVGLQLIGKHFDESTILRAAYHYEQARGTFKHPNI